MLIRIVPLALLLWAIECWDAPYSHKKLRQAVGRLTEQESNGDLTRSQWSARCKICIWRSQRGAADLAAR